MRREHERQIHKMSRNDGENIIKNEAITICQIRTLSNDWDGSGAIGKRQAWS
jgi:hypothetical protein